MSENEKSCRSIVFGNRLCLLYTRKRLGSEGSNADLNEGTVYGAVGWAYMRVLIPLGLEGQERK